MTINMIVCANQLGFIGKDGDLLYKLKKDLEHFKEKTTGNIILCGRKTFESLPIKPLPHRITVVVSSNKNYKVPQGVFLAHSKEQILNHHLETGKNTNDKDLFICGGSKLYEDYLEYTDVVYLTRIKDDVTEGDALFPLHQMQVDFELMKLDAYIEDGVEFTIEEWISEKYKEEYYKLNSKENKE